MEKDRNSEKNYIIEKRIRFIKKIKILKHKIFFYVLILKITYYTHHKPHPLERHRL
jgi:hypothetical protein